MCRAAYVLKGRDSQLNLPLAMGERAELEQHSETSFLARLAEENHILWGSHLRPVLGAGSNGCLPQPLPAAAAWRIPHSISISSCSSRHRHRRRHRRRRCLWGRWRATGRRSAPRTRGEADGGAVAQAAPHRAGQHQQRGRGRQPGGPNAPPGVRWVQSANKWLAYIRLNGSSLTLGYRKKMADAAKLHERYTPSPSLPTPTLTPTLTITPTLGLTLTPTLAATLAPSLTPSLNGVKGPLKACACRMVGAWMCRAKYKLSEEGRARGWR